jgi:tetraprenyl-beta-curcumene synthase
MIALDVLHSKRANLEGAAAFAAFAPPPQRAGVIRASIALQAIYDYADTLMEQPHHDPAANARQLHFALQLALHEPGAPHSDYYAHYPNLQDNRYLRSLVDVCRAAFASLPSYDIVRDLLRRNIERIISYQTLIDRPSVFATWAVDETPADADLRWWETGAACGSSMAILALIAAAANRHLVPSDAQNIERVYFPWVGALHTLLDSLIDRPEDLVAGQHSLVGHYDSTKTTAERMHFIASEATRRAEELPDSPSHALILAGMTAQYLSTSAALLPHARPTRDSVIDVMGALSRPTTAVFSVRQCAVRFRKYEAQVSVCIKCLESAYAYSGLYTIRGARQDRLRDGHTLRLIRVVEANG